MRRGLCPCPRVGCLGVLASIRYAACVALLPIWLCTWSCDRVRRHSSPCRPVATAAVVPSATKARLRRCRFAAQMVALVTALLGGTVSANGEDLRCRWRASRRHGHCRLHEGRQHSATVILRIIRAFAVSSAVLTVCCCCCYCYRWWRKYKVVAAPFVRPLLALLFARRSFSLCSSQRADAIATSAAVVACRLPAAVS